jgi:hypothetical protein
MRKKGSIIEPLARAMECQLYADNPFFSASSIASLWVMPCGFRGSVVGLSLEPWVGVD